MVFVMTQVVQHFGRVHALFLGAALALASPASAGDYSETCRYFAGQAFKDRRAGGETTLAMNLAQDCVDALVYLRSDDPGTRERAGRYLEQLDTYRGVMVAMLVSRARERTRQTTGLTRHMRPAVPPVSEAGSYLIARDMGLLETHESWTSWRQSLASADPRVRVE